MLFRTFFACLSFAAFSAAAAQAGPPDFSQIPFVSDAARASIQRDYARVRCKPTYLVAVSPDGHWASRCSGSKLSVTIIRAVLQKCQHAAGQPCGLAVARGQNLPDWQAVPALTYSKTVSYQTLPFVADLQRADLVARYGDASGKKALAISRNGAWAYASQRLTLNEARKAALSKCEENDGNRRRCFLYAEGEEVLFGPGTDIYPER